jgi:uncharacterized protein YecT (DUF1311 family)
MPRPIDAYREGYENGRKDNLAGHVSEAMFGMLRDDPGGHYATGYHDGAARKKFNPPSEEVRKAAPRQSAGSLATDLEKSWYQLCNGSVFIPKHIADYYISALHAEGSNVAVMVGLSDFTADTCPRCGGQGQFKILFLGRLEHPECHWTGYMGTGSYIGFQIMQIVHSGIRAGGSMKDDADRKGDRSGGVVMAIFGFLFVGVFRAALAVVLIPLHTMVALLQTGQTTGDVVTRVIALCVMLAALGIGSYEIQSASRQSPASQQARVIQPFAPQLTSRSNSSEIHQPSVTPSFDCSKARTRVELLICHDSHLAVLDVEMASTYNQALSRLPQNARLTLRREHLVWFKNYSHTCNQSNNGDRAACVANYLTSRTSELKNRWQ